MLNSRLEEDILNFLGSRNLQDPQHSGRILSFPFVTIGVCVKNSEEIIGECLKSIVNSNYDESKLEIIVVNGNSIDNTVKVAKEILDKSAIDSKILSDQGKGLGYARQMVVENAIGKYICWVDADSVLLPDFIANGVASLENEIKVGFVIPLILFEGQSIFARLQGYAWLMPTLNASVNKKTPNLAMNGAITPLMVLEDVGGFNTNIKGAGEDVDLFERIRLKGYEIKINPRAQLYHRVETSWRELFRHVSWWAKGSPRKSFKRLLTEGFRRQLLFFKWSIDIFRFFKDPVGIVIPFYGMIWNIWYTFVALA